MHGAPIGGGSGGGGVSPLDAVAGLLILGLSRGGGGGGTQVHMTTV